LPVLERDPDNKEGKNILEGVNAMITRKEGKKKGQKRKTKKKVCICFYICFKLISNNFLNKKLMNLN